MKFGYARVSTVGQNLDNQWDALNKEGCEEIFSEYISGAVKERPELNKLIDKLRSGDVVVVWRLDRLGRNLVNIINLVLQLTEKGVTVKGISDGVDTSTPTGRLMLNIMASFAEYERECIRERTHAGLGAARARGRLGGRPKGLKAETISKLKMIRILSKDTSKTPREIYESMNVAHASYYRYLKILENYSDEELSKFINEPKRKNNKT